MTTKTLFWMLGLAAFLGPHPCSSLGAEGNLDLVDVGVGQSLIQADPVLSETGSIGSAPPASSSRPELLLTGIVELAAKKWAFVTTAERGQPLKLYTLKEGDKADGLEVLAIDARAETVRIRLAGQETVLTFKTQSPWAMERKFVIEHTRAHELREQRERERIERERALAELLRVLTPAPEEGAASDLEEARRQESAVVTAVFSPDGRLIVTGAADHTVRLWDTATGQPVTGPVSLR